MLRCAAGNKVMRASSFSGSAAEGRNARPVGLPSTGAGLAPRKSDRTNRYDRSSARRNPASSIGQSISALFTPRGTSIKPEDFIPHRAPFLLLKEIVSIDDESIVASACPDPNDELYARVYAGHYPGNPITPGVLLCEMVFQAGAALLSHRLGPEAQQGTPVLVRIRDARFKHPVQPGDELEIMACMEDQVSNAFYLKGTVMCGGKLIARVAFTCALTPAELLTDEGKES